MVTEAVEHEQLGLQLARLAVDTRTLSRLEELSAGDEVEAIVEVLEGLGLIDQAANILKILAVLTLERRIVRASSQGDEGAVAGVTRGALEDPQVAGALLTAYLEGDDEGFAQLLDTHKLRTVSGPIIRWIGGFVPVVHAPTSMHGVEGVHLRHDILRLYEYPQLDSIAFNHTPAFFHDALNLRRNATQLVTPPEWRRGTTAEPEDSPAAYALEAISGNEVTIVVHLSAKPGSPATEVRALGGGILGSIDPFMAVFRDGIASPPPVALAHHSIGSGGLYGVKREDIEWRWQARPEGMMMWQDIAVTRHRIYVVRRMPRGPWRQQPFPDLQNPWAEALDFVCTVSGALEPDPYDGLAVATAQLLNWGGVYANPASLLYDHLTTAAHYAGSSFDLTALLERINGGVGNGALVNCTDCACMMTTFANLLGCELWEGQIFTGEVQPTVPIGYGQWWLPGEGFIASSGQAPSATLLFHEVAWKDDLSLSNNIYDVCYLVNGFADPDNPQQAHPTLRIIYYPYGVRFSEAGSFDYREKLARPASILNTVPDISTKVRRPVL